MQAVLTDIDTPFTKTVLNIFEPRSTCIVLPEDIDLVFVPLLSFDEKGYRVGYGKGFYDKWLAGCSPECLKVGISYFGPVESIEDRNDFDVPLDLCITPHNLYVF
jgi:5-formyltetrahydrofolate cyclo-ligase